MDTIPFHCVMFALDIALFLGLLFWPMKRSYFWALVGWIVLGGIGVVGIGAISYIYKTNLGQCIVEGLTYHGSVFLLVAACILFLRKRRVLAVVSALLAILIFGFGFNMLILEPYSLVVEQYTINSPKVRNKIRIVFVADIQTDRIGRHERRTLHTIMEQNPDLIILGGDYLQYYPGTLGTADLPDRFRALFKEARLSAPLGVFAINGNIDPSNREEFTELFEGTGVEAIFGSTIIEDLGIDKDKGPIDLTMLGMADSIDGVGDLGLTETGHFLVMVGHYPNFAIKDYANAEQTPDLMLAGHTHGGQVALPFYGPIRVKFTGREKIITRDYLSGMKTLSNGSKFLISRGSGMERGWAPRVRFLCKPEISVIDIIPQ